MTRGMATGVCLAALCAGASFGQGATAQTTSARASGAELQEVVVTARKRQESVLQVPLAISAFTSQEIKAAGINDVRDLAAVAPGMVVLNAGGNGAGGRAFTNIYFRGVPPLLPLPRTQTGSLFVDGIYVLGATSSIDTSEVERVEVIKGPQSAYFGRNTFAGAINFITRNPGEVFHADGEASAGTRGSYSLHAGVEGPIIRDRLSGRLSVNFSGKGSQYTATDGGRLGAESSRSISGVLVAKPIDGMMLRFRGYYGYDEDDAPAETYLRGDVYGSSCPNSTYGARTNLGAPVTYTGFTVPYFCGSIPTISQLGRGVVTQSTSLAPATLAQYGIPTKLTDILHQSAPEILSNPLYDSKLFNSVPSLNHMGLSRNLLRFALQGSYDKLPDHTTANLNIGYNRTTSLNIFDLDHSDAQNAYIIAPFTYNDFSVEGRVTSNQDRRIRGLAGASFSYIRWRTQALGYQARLLFTQPIVTTGYIAAEDGEDASVIAGFGSVDIDLFKGLTLTGEARYQVDRSKVTPRSATAVQVSFKQWLPRVILKWQPTKDLDLYASYSEGTLPGQTNAQYLAATPYQQQQINAQFAQVTGVTPAQTLYNYEAGIKQRLFSRRLEYSLSAYYMEWNNIFASGVITTPTSATNANPVLFNSIYIPGDATLKGVELDASAAITSKLTARVTFDWQEGIYKDIFASSVTFAHGYVRFDGNHIPRIPDVTVSLSPTWRDHLVGDWDYFVRTDARYYGKAWESEANTARFNAYWRVNLHLGVERGQLSVEAYVNNLFDDSNWDYGFRSTSLAEPGAYLGAAPYQAGVIVQAPDRREFGIRASAKF